MEIRLATDADGEAIKGLDEAAGLNERRQASVDRWLRRRECWVAVMDGRVVAYAAFGYSFYERGFVEMLYVAKNHRGRGIGLALMNHFGQICDTTDMFTSTNQSNMPMQRLLAKGGFLPSGVIENLDEGDPELVYFKRLRNETV